MEIFLDKLITVDKYDERLALYIKEFFLHNARYFGWDRNTICEKEKLLQKRVKGFEFVYLSDKTSAMDYDSKNILLNSRIKQINFDRNSAIALTSEIFSNLDTLTRRADTDRPEEISEGKNTRSLKYCINQKEKERILSIISLDTHKSIDEIYDLNYEYSLIGYPRSILKSDDKTDILYTYLCWYETLLEKFKSDSFFWMLQTKSFQTKKAEEIKTFKQISLIIQQILEEERDAIPDASDPRIGIIKTILSIIKRKLNDIREEIKDEAGKPIIDEKIEIDNFKQCVPSYFIRSVQPEFKDTELTDTYLEQKAYLLSQNYKEEFRPIISEYFVRSAKVYNWSKEEFDKKIRNFSINCKRIEYLKRRDQKNGVIGFWLQDKSKVEVKIKEMKANNILSIFFHEFEHATDVTKRENVVYEDKMLGNINETATEIGATMMMGENPYYDKYGFFINMQGYNYSSQAVGMMSAALGISEFEFARIRDNGLLESDFVEKFNYINIVDILKIYNRILGEIFLVYKDDKKNEKLEILSSAYSKMFRLAKRVLEKRIEHEQATYKGYDKYLAEDKTRYETVKLAKNIKDAISVYKLKGIDEKGFIEENAKMTAEEGKEFLYTLRLLHYYDREYFRNADLYRHIRDEIKYPIIGRFKKIFTRVTNNLLLSAGEREEDEFIESESEPSIMRDANEFKKRIKYSPKRGLLNRRNNNRKQYESREDTKDL